MEMQDLLSDVQALRKLYGLLKSNRNDSQCACSDFMLDEKAKVFLKNLLDGATVRVLEAHSQLTSAQVGVFDASPPATELEELKAMPILRSPFLPGLSKISPGASQITAKALVFKPTPPREDKQKPIKLTKCFTSATEAESRKRRSTAGKQSYVKPTKFVEDNHSMDIGNLQHQQANHCGSYWGTRQVEGIEIEKKPDETDYTSKEVADAFKEVEFRFPSLQLTPEHGGQLGKSEALHGSSGRMASSIPGLDSVTVANGHGNKIWRTVQVTGQSVKAISRKMECPLVGKSDHHTPSNAHESAQGLMLPSSPTNVLNMVSTLPSAIPQRELIRSIGTSQTSKQVSSLGSMGLTSKRFEEADPVHKQTKATDTIPREKGSPNQMISRPKLLAQKHSQCMLSPTLYGKVMDQENGGVQKSGKRVAQRKILPFRQESEAASSSSSWTTQEASSPTRGQGDMSSSNSSDHEGYFLPGWTVGPYMGPASSSESEGYPSLDQVPACHHRDLSPRVVSPASTSVGSSKDSRSGNRVKLKKQRGGFRRLKDKLALVFHHHHHHHHGDDSDQKTKAGRGTSLWKNAGKIFHGKSKHDSYGEQAVEEHRKSVVCKVADKNQHGHFHKLVKGLLGQVQKSKHSKLSKDGIKQLAGSRRGGKKVAKKLQWWKMFRHQKAGKPRSKPYGNLGFVSKKPRFKALPKTR